MTEKSGLPFVTLPVVRELLETQERCFTATMQMLIDSIREEVKDIRNTVNELKESLTFSQKDIDDAKSNISKIETKITKADEDISEAYGDIEYLLDGQESFENYSRRNNIKVFGIPEKDTNNGSDPEVWEEFEAAVKNEIHTKLKINPESMVIERAHRVGKCRDPFHHLADGTKVKSRPRPIVAKFLSWKDKERVLRSARSIKPDGVQFLEDFSKRTLDKRKEKIPELIAARKSGKRAFLVMDKIIIANNTKPP